MDIFAANDIAAFAVISGTPTETTSNVDTAYTPRGIFPNGGGLQSANFMNPTTGVTVSQTDLWFHCELFTANNGGLTSLIEFVDSAGTSVVRLVSTTNVTFRIDYWNGAAWVAGATTFNPGSVRIAVDIHIVCGLSGSLNVYFGGTLQLTTTGLNAAVDNVQSFKLFGAANYTYSQMLVATVNTIGVKVASLTPTANGTNTAWTNDYTNLVKTGINDATMISDAVLNDKESYVASDPLVPAGFTISSIWYAIRARLNSATPANILPLVRIAATATDYAGAYNFGGLNSVSFGPSIACFPTDPSGGSWGTTNANAAEVGVKTAT